MNTESIKTNYRILPNKPARKVCRRLGSKPIREACQRLIAVTAFILAAFFFLSGCGKAEPAVSQTPVHKKINTDERLTEGTVTLSASQLSSYGEIADCLFQDDKETVCLTLNMPEIPKSDDPMIYLFAFELFEEGKFSDNVHREPVTSAKKGTRCRLEWNYEDRQLFQQFVPALLLNGKYVPLSTGICISNPEMLADVEENVTVPKSKKGLLLDPQMLETPLLEDLDVKYAIYNIPLSHIMGETDNEVFPTISYEYQGKTYKFNGAGINGYDYLFSYLTECGMNCTAIILNDWNEEYPEMIHPLSRNEDAKAYYYAFNTADKEGCLYLEAIASFLAERYSGKEHGMVSNWVIANEINQQKIWNYMDTDDIRLYCTEFEKAMRIFYNAARSHYAGANVYFSIDHEWNDDKNSNENFFNAKEVVEIINEIAREKGNYDWGLAIHPYPDPLTRVNYWTETYDKTENAPILTLMNLSTLTDMLTREEYLKRDGEVRSVTVTELGFSSASGEKLQAAAFAYCYYIIEANPYVDAFFMNRQTDALEEVKQGLSFGIYNMDQTPKYIQDTFKYIDTSQARSHTEFILNILGADTIEEALSWAQ